MAKSNPEEKKSGKLQWFLVVILIPIMFLVTVTIVVLTLTGVNVFEEAEKYGSKIPGVSTLVSEDGQEEASVETEQLKATIANNNAEIEQLEEQVSSKDNTIEDLNQQLSEYEARLEKSEEAGEGDDTENPPDKVSELASSFKDMDAEQAAQIIENLDEVIAVQVLENVPSTERGEILGAMDPELAASLTNAFLGAGN
ncbi:MotE family protein [Thalassobacillus sp. CUG 92003]|uniref:MotE family protein n=1 Tax=Thalassobacillus sp. CUG 92003 TaxID=2736641 RepID=UPI0015E74D6D|nr:hypothetical protein [Thalassobacillus sp. CUG 92003]